MTICRSCGKSDSSMQEICPICGHSIFQVHAEVHPIGRTLDQNRELHVLLTQTDMIPYKESLVQTYTNERETSSKNMYFHECKNLIDYLKEIGPVITSAEHSINKMRRKVAAICHDMGWTVPNNNGKKVDRDRVNRFLEKYGIVKKSFYALDHKELQITIHQFEKLREYQFKNV